MVMYAAVHAALHRLTDAPVLPVGDIPELYRIAGIEAGLLDLAGLEQKAADDVGSLRAACLQYEHSGMVAGQAHKQVRIENLPLVPLLLVRIEARKRTPRSGPAVGKRVGAIAVGHAAHPIQARSARLAKRRHHGTQLRMHAATVITLVVVFADRLPVGGNGVGDRMPDAQISQRVACNALRDLT